MKKMFLAMAITALASTASAQEADNLCLDVQNWTPVGVQQPVLAFCQDQDGQTWSLWVKKTEERKVWFLPAFAFGVEKS